jgi:hypothetical protein
MQAMRAKGFNEYGDLRLVKLLLSAREASDRFVQRPRVPDPKRKINGQHKHYPLLTPPLSVSVL